MKFSGIESASEKLKSLSSVKNCPMTKLTMARATPDAIAAMRAMHSRTYSLVSPKVKTLCRINYPSQPQLTDEDAAVSSTAGLTRKPFVPFFFSAGSSFCFSDLIGTSESLDARVGFSVS